MIDLKWRYRSRLFWVWFGFEFVPMSLFLSFTPEQIIIIS